MLLRIDAAATATLFAVFALFALFALLQSDSCIAGSEQRPRFEEVYENSIFEASHEHQAAYTSSTSGETPTAAPLNPDVLGTTLAPVIQENEEEVIEDESEPEDEVEDDDYNVVILADDVPWDLTEDTPDIPNQQLVENTEPTMSPTQPIPEEDDDDYVVIIVEDDVPWDDVAVAEYVKDEFEALNNANSNVTENNDDDYNEDLQDELPSLIPTIIASPTVSPNSTQLTTSSPVGVSTVPPTSTPTGVPSDYPSDLPTESPSLAPSASPTISCHDEESYRSPINGLTCDQHKHTNCLSWRHVGLNMTELETLVSSCPITCNIDCGSFQLFSAPVSFRISRVAGFMDPNDVDSLMNFSIEFLEDFVRKYISLNINILVDRSESNDTEDESDVNDSDVNDEGFFDHDAIKGGAVTFEIEMAELTAQNLVEESLIPIGRSEVSDDIETKDISTGGASRRLRQLRSGSLEDVQRTKQQSSGGKSSIINTDESLDVIITFGGFTIGLNPEKMSELLVSGIEGVDFTRELQQSRIDFFSDASVSSATETIEEDFFVEEDIVEDDVEENSTVSVLISYLVPIVVIGFAIGSLFYHRCYVKGGWGSRHNIHRQNAIERAQIGGMTATPMAAAPGDGIVTSNSNDEDSGGYFNFRRHVPNTFNVVEEHENARTKKANANQNIESGNKVEVGHSAFTRLVTAFNFNLSIARSKNSADEDENKDPDDASYTSSNKSNARAEEEEVQRNKIPIICEDLVSPISGDSEKDDAVSFDSQNFKPYTSALPPMIVIDNIDGPDVAAMSPVMMATDSTTSSGNGMRDPSVRSSSTPLEKLDAVASEFRKQLSRSSMNATNRRHPSFSGSFYAMNSSSALDLGSCQDSLFGPNAEDDGQMIKGMVSEDWDGDDLFSPIPSNITTNDGEVESEEDYLPNPEQTSSSSDSDEHEEVPSNMTRTTPIHSARRSLNYGTWDGSTSSSQPVSSLDSKLLSSSIPAVMHRGTKSDGSLPKGLPPKRPPTPERGNSGNRPIVSEQQHRRASFPKVTPIVEAFVGDSSSSNSTFGDGHRRKSSSDTAPDLPKNSSSISAISTDDLVIGRSKSDGSNYNRNRLEFEAPRKGNWGLVLESSSKTGPRIYAVKDYSPLFGLVQKGDKLLEIDGKNVSQSSLTEVTKLLKGKSSSYPYHRPTSATMPIVISRGPYSNIDYFHAHGNVHGHHKGIKDLNYRYPQNGEYNHKRNNSYGSYGSAGSSGSRVVEDVDDDNNDDAVYYLDHQQQQQIHPHHHPSFDYDSSNEI